MEESHTKEQSPQAVLWEVLWARRSKIAAKWARTRAWAGWWFFGRKKKCVGSGISGGEPPWAHKARGRTLDPRGQVPAPPAVFLVPDILKYSRKNHISISRLLENFYFRGIFYCTDKSENRQENTIFTLFQLNNRKYREGMEGCASSFIHLMLVKRNPLTRLIKSC